MLKGKYAFLNLLQKGAVTDLANNEMITFMVENPDGLVNAIQLAQNAQLSHYTITCSNTHKMFGEAPLTELQRAVSLLNNSASDFSKSQLRKTASEYRYYPFPGKVSATFRKIYMSTAKEVNDVRCVAAEIGEILHSRLNGRNTLNNAIHEYQKWINEFFDYKNTGSINDHTAIGLLKNRSGVCQAIAAVTMLIFPYLGYSVQYISGEAYGGNSWGPHAWNAIRSNNKWVHVDFTFGMHSLFTPNNDGSMANRTFSKTHRWDNNLLSDNMLSNSNTIQVRIVRNTVELFVNKNTFFLGDVAVQTTAPVLVGNDEIGYWIDLHSILPFFEGACEYLPKSDHLRICLKNRSILIDNAKTIIDKSTGYIDLRAIRKFADFERESTSPMSLILRWNNE